MAVQLLQGGQLTERILQEAGARIPAATIATLREELEARPFSVRYELSAIIAAGAGMFCAGIGILIKEGHIPGSLVAHAAALVGMALVLVVTWLQPSRAVRVAGSKETGPRHAAYLNLGTLLLASGVGFLTARFDYSLHWIPWVGFLLLLAAEYCRSRIVLVHAIVLVGTYIGIEAMPEIDDLGTFNVPRVSGLLYATFLLGMAWGESRRRQPYFTGTFIDCAVPVGLVASIFDAVKMGPNSTGLLANPWAGFLLTVVVALGVGGVALWQRKLRFCFYAIVALEAAFLVLWEKWGPKEDIFHWTVVTLSGVATICLILTVTQKWYEKFRRDGEEDEGEPHGGGVWQRGPFNVSWRQFQLDSIRGWRKAGILPGEVAKQWRNPLRPFPRRTGRFLRGLLLVATVFVAGSAMVLAGTIVGKYPVGLSFTFSAVSLLGGYLLVRSGRFRTGIDEGLWIFAVITAMLGTGSLTDVPDGAFRLVGFLVALIPVLVSGDVTCAVMAWGLLVTDTLERYHSAASLFLAMLALLLVCGFRRVRDWCPQRVWLLFLIQGLCLFMIFACGNLPSLASILGLGSKPLETYVLPPEPLALTWALVIPGLCLAMGVFRHARLPLDVGIISLTLSLLTLPPSRGWSGWAVSYLLTGLILFFSGLTIWRKIASGARKGEPKGVGVASRQPNARKPFTVEVQIGSLEDDMLGKILQQGYDVAKAKPGF